MKNLNELLPWLTETRVTGIICIWWRSQIIRADGGTGFLSAITSDESCVSPWECGKLAGWHWYDSLLYNCTPLASWKTSSGTKLALLDVLIFFDFRVVLPLSNKSSSLWEKPRLTGLKDVFSVKRLANSNQGHSYFPHTFLELISISYFIVKMRILFLLRWSYRSPKLCWLLNLE